MYVISSNIPCPQFEWLDNFPTAVWILDGFQQTLVRLSEPIRESEIQFLAGVGSSFPDDEQHLHRIQTPDRIPAGQRKLVLIRIRQLLHRIGIGPIRPPRFQFQLGRWIGFLERGRWLPPQRDEVLHQGQGQQSRNCRLLLRRILVLQLFPDPPQRRLQQQPSDLRHHLSVRWSELLRCQEFENQSNDDEERLTCDQWSDSGHRFFSIYSYSHTQMFLEPMIAQS